MPAAPGTPGAQKAPGAPGTAVLPRPAAPPAAGPGGVPARRPRAGAVAVVGGVRGRLAQATRTAPGRLRLAGVVLAVLTVAFGALTAWQLTARAQAADRVVSYGQPLSRDAAEIHRRLADAATTATTGFLLAGNEPQKVRTDYTDDLKTAAQLITEASARTTSPAARTQLGKLNQQLPVYAGLVDTARANDRLGIPLGGAYLRYASEQMQNGLLPAAVELTRIENEALAKDYADAKSTPWAAYGLAAVTLAALVWVQVTLFRRTNRVFNPGLLGATAAVLAGGLWLAVTGLTTSAALVRADKEGGAPLRALNTARVDVLKARLAENLHYVARGSTAKYVKQWDDTTTSLVGKDDTGAPMERRTGSLPTALTAAPSAARPSLLQAARQYDVWHGQHDAARAKEVKDSDYQGALDATVSADGGAPTSDATFHAVDQALAQAAGIEQDTFLKAARGTHNDLRNTAVGAALLGLAAAAAALGGLGRRLAEYR
ncbi:hypothetical protein ACFQ6N_20660 [Kitasatospora sp. NPDC056446]|uniref:hypothetical protein n=1 Tax=Kitasatospora sp. NPDC056446 TaxID=3345819 RepID=UPI003676283D